MLFDVSIQAGGSDFKTVEQVHARSKVEALRQVVGNKPIHRGITRHTPDSDYFTVGHDTWKVGWWEEKDEELYLVHGIVKTKKEKEADRRREQAAKDLRSNLMDHDVDLEV